MTKLQVGDTVCLISGGPPMTVEEVVDGSTSCVWFDPDTATIDRRGVFSLSTLVNSDPFSGDVASLFPSRV